MLAVGRALMGKPRLLLMDEPTLGMSPLLCQATTNWLVTISQLGLTILLAEQNATVAFNGLTSHNIRANLRMTWHFGEVSIS